MTTVDDRVRRGAALLDERGPASWRARVNRVTLDLRHPSHCVVGQTYRVQSDPFAAYDEALYGLGAPRHSDTHTWAVEHGFEGDGPLDYGRLTLAWRAYLTTGSTDNTVTTDEEKT